MRIPTLKATQASHLVLGVIFVFCLALVTQSSSSVVAATFDHTFIETNYLPALKGLKEVAVGQPLGQNELWHMAVVHEGRVQLYEIADLTTGPYRELAGMPSPAVSVAFADYNNDGRDDLWVGSAGSGNIYVYSVEEGYPLLGKSAGRVWSPIVKVLTPDIDGDSFPDAVVLTETGAVHAFLQRKEGLVSLWSSGPREGKVQHILAYDLNDDGCDEVILARDGYAAVWQWLPLEEDAPVIDPALAQAMSLLPAPKLGAAIFTPLIPPKKELSTVRGQLVQLWGHDTFQGTIKKLAAGNFDQNRLPELLITTSANRLYTVVVNSQSSMSIGNITEEPSIAPALQMSVVLGDTDLLFGSENDVLKIWQQKSGTNTFDVFWQSDYKVKYTQAIQAGERFVLLGTDGVRFYKKIPRSYVSVMVNGQPYTQLQAEPIVVAGEVYLSAKDWATLLNLPAPGWHPNGRLTLFSGLQYLIAIVDRTDVLLGLRSVRIGNAPRNIEGTVYLPSQAVGLLAGTIKWYPQTHILSIR